MLRFMVLGAPRSATAWTANWLSSDGRVCLHDAMWDHHYTEMDSLAHVWGVACTGLAYFPEWVNEHRCPKVVLHRPIGEINRSLQALGLPWVNPKLVDNLWKCQGLHVNWTELFRAEGAREIHEHLQVGAFDEQRWKMLKDLKVTSNWQSRQAHQNPQVVKRFRQEIGVEALS
jgi:hypothetical protein